MPIKSTDPEVMKNYLYHAMEQEKYVYIWNKALDEVNSEIKKTSDRIDQKKSQIHYNDAEINSLDSRYADMADQNEKKTDLYDKRGDKCKKTARAMLILMIVIFALWLVFLIGSIVVVAVVSKSAEDVSSLAILTFPLSMLLMLLMVFEVAPTIIFVVNLVKSKNAKRALTRTEKIDLSGQKLSESESLNSSKITLDEDLKRLQTHDLEIKLDQHDIMINLNQSKKALSEIYALNVLPSKYRNFVAIATLYEYIDTGRCDQIEGHGGIYDTYENDLRLGLIIGSLSDIRSALGRIENNQDILIREYRQANDSLNSIKSSLTSIRESNDSIARSNEEIARNTAISAVANQQTAAAARWIEWNSWK